VLRILQVETDDHRRCLREIWWEYLCWANSMNVKELGVDLDVEAMLEKDMVGLDRFSPPTGCLLLAQYDAYFAGCACMERIAEHTAGIKRMFVRPAFRRKGIGRALLEGVIDRARQAGYSRVRLDSARYMKEAQALYHSVGFKDIEPFVESEIPQEFHAHWVFMEITL
jgi:GNAT superfamily N-acetyltransferase